MMSSYAVLVGYMNIAVYVAVTFMVTMTFSYLSWWRIEKPFLALKKSQRSLRGA